LLRPLNSGLKENLIGDDMVEEVNWSVNT
jgi:hypothetical protein